MCSEAREKERGRGEENYPRHRRPSNDGPTGICKSDRPKGSGLLPRLSRPKAVPDRPDQLAGLGESHHAIHGENDLTVHFHVVYTVVPGKDRKSTRLNSSHLVISYAVFCLKKKNDTAVSRSGVL